MNISFFINKSPIFTHERSTILTADRIIPYGGDRMGIFPETYRKKVQKNF